MGNCYSGEDNEPRDGIIFKSPHADIVIPDITMWEITEKQAKLHGDKPAFVCGLTHESITFSDLFTRASRLAAALQHDGVHKGSVVMLHSFNCIEYPIVILALVGLGAVCSPSSPMFLANELSRQITTAKASFVITHKQLENVAFEAAANAGLTSESIYTIGSTKAETTHNFKNINELVLQDKWVFNYKRIDPSTLTNLPFSSGTTGVPKGVKLTARNMVANVLQTDYMDKLSDYSMGLLPFFHIYGTMTINLAIVQAKAMVVLPRFKPETFLDALATYKIRTVHVAPPVVLFMGNSPLVEKYDISATRYLVSGGAPLGKEVAALVEKRLGIHVKQAHGMTELSPVANYSEDSWYKLGSVGRLPPNTELRVVCLTTGKDLPANSRGELLYRGPQVMMGYDNNPEATSSVLTKSGFMRTGDVGYIDDDGFVYVVDRAKELIKYKGHGVAPAELEDLLNHHHDVLDSCCVRGQDAKGEEIPKAFVVLKHPNDPSAPTAEDIMAYVSKRVAPYKKIRQLEFIDAIPKNASGKLLRRKLQDREAHTHMSGVAA